MFPSRVLLLNIGMLISTTDPFMAERAIYGGGRRARDHDALWCVEVSQ